MSDELMTPLRGDGQGWVSDARMSSAGGHGLDVAPCLPATNEVGVQPDRAGVDTDRPDLMGALAGAIERARADRRVTS